jgi:Xaa-Pro aminopeptidase
MGLARERLGIEMQANYLTAYEFEHLKAALPGTRFEDATDIIHGFRMVKSPKELEYIQEAARLSSLGMRTAIETVRPGLKEYEVAGSIYNAMVSAGSDYFGPIYLLSGERTHALHDTWRDREIQGNDHVYVELSGNCQRYVATFMRTIAVGNVDPSVERMAEGSIAALDAAEREFRPGMTSHEAAGVLKRAYRNATNLDLPYGLLGYSLGISFPPGFGEWYVFAIAEGDERELREDMCLHLTPVNTIEGVGTVGLSEPVQVTKDGIKCLASVERQLWKL